MSFTLTSSVTNNTANNGKIGQISITSIQGGTAPYTYYWSDYVQSSGTSYTSGTISRTALYAGDYIFTITDSKGVFYTETFTVMGTFTTPATLHLGTVTSGYLGLSTAGRSLDVHGRVCIVSGYDSSNTIAYRLSDVIIYLKTGSTWLCYGSLTVPGGDISNYVYGVSTNGNSIAVLMCAVNTVNSVSTTYKKVIYIYTVSGNLITYSTTIPVYTNGTSTYVYAMSGQISFRENTICIPVRPASTDSIYGYVYKLSANAWSYHSSVSLTGSTSSTIMYCTQCSVGSDSYLYISNYNISNGSFTNAGSITMAYYNGSTYVTTSISGTASSQYLGRSMSAYKDSVLYNHNSTSAYLYTFTNGVLSYKYMFTIFSNIGLDSLVLYKNTIIYPTSATQYALATRKSSATVWTTLSGSNNTILSTTSNFGMFCGSFATNGIDIIYADPGASSGLGQILWSPAYTVTPTVLVSPGTYDGTSIGPPVVYLGCESYTYYWADSPITTSTRTDVKYGTQYTLVVKDFFNNAASYTYGSFALTSTVQKNTMYNQNGGSISITAIYGGTAPYTYYWSDLVLPTTSSYVPGTTISRTSLFAGNYTINVSDAKGILYSETFTVMGVLAASDTQLHQGTIASGYFGYNPYLRSLDTNGRICVGIATNQSYATLSRLSDVVVYLKTDSVWVKHGTLAGSDTTNYVVGVSTNGNSIALLMSSNSNSNSYSTTYTKFIYLYTLNGNVLIYLSTIPIYASGSTYVYGYSGKISFRDNTICVPVRPTTNDAIYGYIYKWTGTTYAYHSGISLIGSTSASLLYWTQCCVGSDNYVYLSNYTIGQKSLAGSITMSFWNGSTWICDSVPGVSSSQYLGRCLHAYKDSCTFNFSASTTAYVYTFTYGIRKLGTSFAMIYNTGMNALAMAENTVVYPTSSTSYTYQTRPSSTSIWSFASISSANTSTGATAIYTDAMTTNGVDFIYSDGSYNSNYGQLRLNSTTTYSAPPRLSGAPSVGSNLNTVSCTATVIPGSFSNVFYAWFAFSQAEFGNDSYLIGSASLTSNSTTTLTLSSGVPTIYVFAAYSTSNASLTTSVGWTIMNTGISTSIQTTASIVGTPVITSDTYDSVTCTATVLAGSLAASAYAWFLYTSSSLTTLATTGIVFSSGSPITFNNLVSGNTYYAVPMYTTLGNSVSTSTWVPIGSTSYQVIVRALTVSDINMSVVHTGIFTSKIQINMANAFLGFQYAISNLSNKNDVQSWITSTSNTELYTLNLSSNTFYKLYLYVKINTSVSLMSFVEITTFDRPIISSIVDSRSVELTWILPGTYPSSLSFTVSLKDGSGTVVGSSSKNGSLLVQDLIPQTKYDIAFSEM